LYVLPCKEDKITGGKMKVYILHDADVKNEVGNLIPGTILGVFESGIDLDAAVKEWEDDTGEEKTQGWDFSISECNLNELYTLGI